MDEIRDIQRQGGSRIERSEARVQRRIAEITQRMGAVDGLKGTLPQVNLKAEAEAHALAREAMSRSEEAREKFVSGGVPQRAPVSGSSKAVDFIMEHDLGFADGGIIAAVVRWRTAGQNVQDLFEARQLLTRLIDIESTGTSSRS